VLSCQWPWFSVRSESLAAPGRARRRDLSWPGRRAAGSRMDAGTSGTPGPRAADSDGGTGTTVAPPPSAQVALAFFFGFGLEPGLRCAHRRLSRGVCRIIFMIMMLSSADSVGTAGDKSLRARAQPTAVPPGAPAAPLTEAQAARGNWLRLPRSALPLLHRSRGCQCTSASDSDHRKPGWSATLNGRTSRRAAGPGGAWAQCHVPVPEAPRAGSQSASSLRQASWTGITDSAWCGHPSRGLFLKAKVPCPLRGPGPG
jgi:hypothetical protein